MGKSNLAGPPPGLRDASNHAKHRHVILMNVITYGQLLARIASHSIVFAKIELRLPVAIIHRILIAPWLIHTVNELGAVAGQVAGTE